MIVQGFWETPVLLRSQRSASIKKIVGLKGSEFWGSRFRVGHVHVQMMELGRNQHRPTRAVLVEERCALENLSPPLTRRVHVGILDMAQSGSTIINTLGPKCTRCTYIERLRTIWGGCNGSQHLTGPRV